MSSVYAARRVGVAALAVGLVAVLVLALRLTSGAPGVRLALADGTSVGVRHLASAPDAPTAGKIASWAVRPAAPPADAFAAEPGGSLPAERQPSGPPAAVVDDGAQADTEPVDEPPPAPEPAVLPGRGPGSLLPELDPDGLREVAQRTGIPLRALAAYAGAAKRLESERPGCGVTWSTLAAIGYHESHHGSYGGGQLREDGLPTQPIVGPPLDGGPGVRAIRDSDGGALDGDSTWDRAVGPMQFIPTTWAQWGVDASGNGVADPQHIDDAALAAARYLCASGGDMTQGSSWWRAVTTYNRSDAYARAVLHAANVYAQRSHG